MMGSTLHEAITPTTHQQLCTIMQQGILPGSTTEPREVQGTTGKGHLLEQRATCWTLSCKKLRRKDLT